MSATDALAKGRDAYAGQRWQEAFDCLSSATTAVPLAIDDVERLAVAAYLLGERRAWTDAWARAYQLAVDEGEPRRAASNAFWLAYAYINEGNMTLAGGWLGRAQRLVEESGTDCAEAGYLLLPAAIEGCEAEPARSLESFERALACGERYHDRDLIGLANLGRGWALIGLAEPAKGLAALDEALLSVTSGGLSPIVAGDLYCGVIEACGELFDLRRAREWTASMTAWCEKQHGLVPFRGQCLVYRSSVLQYGGTWEDAMREALDACERLSVPEPHPAAGAAYYQCGELHRLRGEFAEAEQAYRLADQHGRQPQPGLALLRLAEGQVQGAAGSIRRLRQETLGALKRSRILPAAVDILLAAGDLDGAAAAAAELREVAAVVGSMFLQAAAEHATGSLMLASGDAQQALGSFRRAQDLWRELGTPFEAGQTRVGVGRCCSLLGDSEGARLEWQAARQAFERLGALPELERLEHLTQVEAQGGAQGLSARELEVLRLVATGMTNRAIADHLIISEKTVARHISNIFTKIGVSSRTAAAAYAYDHALVDSTG